MILRWWIFSVLLRAVAEELGTWILRLWVLVAVSVPIFIWGPPGDPFRDGKVRWMVICLIPLVVVAASRKVEFFLCVWWGWMTFLWAWWGLDHYALLEILLPPLFVFGAKALVELSEGAVWMALRLSYLTQAALGVAQWAKVAPPIWSDYWRATGAIGTIGQETLLGAFLAPLVCVALWRWTKLEFLLGLVACAGCALPGGVTSSMTVAALGGGMAMALWKRVSFRTGLSFCALGFSCLILAGLLHPHDNSFLNTSGRWPVWVIAWGRILENPIGWGPGSWSALYPHWNIPSALGTWKQIHSEGMFALFETGFPGLIFALVGISGILVFTRNPCKATIIGALAVNALGNSTLHYPVTAFLAALALALPEPPTREPRSSSLR